MREQLIQYVNLLFAGNDDVEDIRQEILQNTLDRYDDLIAQGKTPEAAYRLAISGIGDINEILGGHAAPSDTGFEPAPQAESSFSLNKLMWAIAIGLYIVAIIPLILLDMIGMDIVGLCMTLVIVAVATVILLLFSDKKQEKAQKSSYEEDSPTAELKKGLGRLVGAIALAVYLVISFTSGAWYITWVIFPIAAAVKGLVNAIIDLKEAL